MSTFRKILWPRVLGEGVIIVVSILLAFWIQAWWDGRQEKDEEEIALRSLIEEFRDKREMLDFLRRYNESILQSTKRLLYAGVESDKDLSNENIDKLLADLVFNNYVSNWSSAALDSIIDSGDINAIKNTRLRYELGAWSAKFVRIRETMKMEVDFYHQTYVPFLTANASLPQILNSLDKVPGSPNTSYEYGRKFIMKSSYDHSKLLSNRDFQNILLERSILINDILFQEFLGLDERLDATINALENELAELY